MMSFASVPIFVLTTRGLEALTLAELAVIPGISDTAQNYRRVNASFAGKLGDLLALHTADDVFLSVADWTPITHTRAELAALTARAAELDLDPQLQMLGSLRTIPRDLTYSLTANFVGKRNYSVPEIKMALLQGISQRYSHWHYVEDDVDAVLNLRLFIEHEHGVLGLRIGERPLHRRAYKQSHLPGSLKPPVAAAMLMLGGFQPCERILDPFCGSGTILIEAGVAGLYGIGGDVNTQALEYAQRNAREAKMSVSLMQSDAARLPLPAGCVAGVVTNLPWGRQIPSTSSLADLYRQTGCELQRVISPVGKIVLLMPADYLPFLDVGTLGWRLLSQTEISLFGQTPSIFVFQNAAANVNHQQEAGLIT
jgi:tRNA (guanine6-N2)-methyltransferase